MIEIMFVFNFLMIILMVFSVRSNFKKGSALNRMLKDFEECEYKRIYSRDIEELVFNFVAQNAKERLNGLASLKERELIDEKAKERLEQVIDDWCAEFTSKEYDLLLRERLKFDVRERLEQSFREQGNQY